MGAQAFRLTNTDIDNGLKNDHFEVVFQPIFTLTDGALSRLEAFIRWNHPGLGQLPPGAFIPFFEAQGRIGELTRFVADKALAAHKDRGGADGGPSVSVNISTVDLADASFPEHIELALRRLDIAPHNLTLECPLPEDDNDIDRMALALAKLKDIGVRLAVEARGRVIDRLSLFDPFPFDEIKTGGAAILRFARTVRGPGLSAISDLLDFAKEHNATTVAVGVEDQASLSALRGLGFKAAQGNHLARPAALDDFALARINDVRERLGLTALPLDELRFSPPKAAERPRPPRPHVGARLALNLPRFTQDESAQDAVSAPVSQSAPDEAPAPEARPSEAVRGAAEAFNPYAKQLQERLTEAYEDADAETQSPQSDRETPVSAPGDGPFEDEAEVVIQHGKDLDIPEPPAAPTARPAQTRRPRARVRRKRWLKINGFWPKSWKRWWRRVTSDSEAY